MTATFIGRVRHVALVAITVAPIAGSLPACATEAPAPGFASVKTAAAPAEDGPGAPAAGVALQNGSAPAAGDLLPLLRPGRLLHFRGRSRLDLSRPEDRLRPSVGHVFSTLHLSGDDGDGHLLLSRELFPYSDDSATAAGLSAPRERRRETLRLDPAVFTIERLTATSEPRLGRDRWGAPAPLRFTSDGFGLNAAARRQARLHSVAIPRELYLALVQQGEITHEYDFYLVAEDPLGDRVVVPAAPGAAPPAGAERRVRGRTMIRVEGREPFPLDRRFPVPPLPDDPRSPPLPGRPDQRVRLPALRVRVEADLVIEPVEPHGGGRTERRDRLTWTVLDRAGEPWLLAWEGLVRTESGDAADPDIREASVSRDLVRVEETGSLP